jgi:hypothetical protein
MVGGLIPGSGMNRSKAASAAATRRGGQMNRKIERAAGHADEAD